MKKSRWFGVVTHASYAPDLEVNVHRRSRTNTVYLLEYKKTAHALARSWRRRRRSQRSSRKLRSKLQRRRHSSPRRTMRCVHTFLITAPALHRAQGGPDLHSSKPCQPIACSWKFIIGGNNAMYEWSRTWEKPLEKKKDYLPSTSVSLRLAPIMSFASVVL